MTNINIKTFEPHPSKAIVIEFNAEETSLSELNRTFEYINNKFPTNTIIALPNYMSLHVFSKNELENYISILTEAIKEL